LRGEGKQQARGSSKQQAERNLFVLLLFPPSVSIYQSISFSLFISLLLFASSRQGKASGKRKAHLLFKLLASNHERKAIAIRVASLLPRFVSIEKREKRERES